MFIRRRIVYAACVDDGVEVEKCIAAGHVLHEGVAFFGVCDAGEFWTAAAIADVVVEEAHDVVWEKYVGWAKVWRSCLRF